MGSVQSPYQQNIVDSYVGRRLKLLRKQQGVSQKELASRLGVTFQQIQKYEKGLNRLPASRMLSICFALDITPNDLFHDLLNKTFPLPEPTDYTSEEIDLIECIRRLEPSGRSKVKSVAISLVRNPTH